MLWAERAYSFGKRERPADKDDPRWQRHCPVCGVVPGVRCHPMHAGERDVGDWVHPVRVADSYASVDPLMFSNLLKGNVITDKLRHDDKGRVVAARLRVFRTNDEVARAYAGQPDGEGGEIARYQIGVDHAGNTTMARQQ